MLHLDDPLSQAHDVSSDADTAPGDVAEGEDFVVGAAGLSCDHAGTAKVFDSDSFLCSNNVDDLPSIGALLGVNDALIQALVILVREVEVIEALGRVVGVGELDLELGLELFDEADASSGVASNVDAGDLELPRVLGGGEVEVVLVDTETSGLDGDVVGDEDNVATLGVLGRLVDIRNDMLFAQCRLTTDAERCGWRRRGVYLFTSSAAPTNCVLFMCSCVLKGANGPRTVF